MQLVNQVTNGKAGRNILCNWNWFMPVNILQFQVEKFLKWVNEPMDEEASQESVSHDDVQDACTSSDSEEQGVSVTKEDKPLEMSNPEPAEGHAISSAGELETEKNEGDSTVAAVTDKEDCVAQDIPDSLQVETEGKSKYASNCWRV